MTDEAKALWRRIVDDAGEGKTGVSAIAEALAARDARIAELEGALTLADSLLHSDEIQSLAKNARVKGFTPDCRRIRQALETKHG